MKQYKEIRTITVDRLRNLCIKNNWYTAGDCEDYDHLLLDLASNKDNLTTDDILAIAQDIMDHSDMHPDCTIADIAYEVNRIALTRFVDAPRPPKRGQQPDTQPLTQEEQEAQYEYSLDTTVFRDDLECPGDELIPKLRQLHLLETHLIDRWGFDEMPKWEQKKVYSYCVEHKDSPVCRKNIEIMQHAFTQPDTQEQPLTGVTVEQPAMNLNQLAKEIKQAVIDGIAWIAIYKQGRQWGYKIFWFDTADQEEGTLIIQYPEDRKALEQIHQFDSKAILVNGYFDNLGDTSHLTQESLESHIQWQYEESFNLLCDAVAVDLK